MIFDFDLIVMFRFVFKFTCRIAQCWRPRRTFRRQPTIWLGWSRDRIRRRQDRAGRPWDTLREYFPCRNWLGCPKTGPPLPLGQTLPLSTIGLWEPFRPAPRAPSQQRRLRRSLKYNSLIPIQVQVKPKRKHLNSTNYYHATFGQLLLLNNLISIIHFLHDLNRNCLKIIQNSEFRTNFEKNFLA